MPKGTRTALPQNPSTLAELEQTRTSTSNKISGVRTQIKRISLVAGTANEPGDPKDVKRLGKAEKRLEKLLAERDTLTRKIAALKDTGKVDEIQAQADAGTARERAAKTAETAPAAKPDPKRKPAKRGGKRAATKVEATA